MSQIGRNDPCPCGSGKKYKKCCLAKEEAVAAEVRGGRSAVQTAIDWLHREYPEEVDDAVFFGFLGEREEDDLEAFRELPPNLAEMAMININEWLLADAELTIGGKEIPTIELVLGNKGPRLNEAGRAWLREITRRSLSLYEVREVKRGEGLLLQDLINPDEKPVWVSEKAATECVVQWDVLGTRLAQKDGEWVLTGAGYPMARPDALECLEEIRCEIHGHGDDPALERELIGWTIINCWLDSIVEEQPLPRIVDAGSGQKIDLTTDHYRVSDWDVLETVLAKQPDVEGTRSEGWTRFIEYEDDSRRLLASLNPTPNEGLEVFCRTLQLADDTRRWLEKIAGKAVAYKIREVVDPRSKKARESVKPEKPAEIPPEVKHQVIHDYLLKHYQSWPTVPLPALNGKTPRQAVRSKKGREQVVELLKSIEQREQRRNLETGDEPFDIAFLWESLRLKREDFCK